MKILVEAAASHNRVALDQALIDQLPEVVEKAAYGLANANVSVLNGAKGLSQVASGLVSQGVAIFDAIATASFTPTTATTRTPHRRSLRTPIPARRSAEAAPAKADSTAAQLGIYVYNRLKCPPR